MNEMNSKGAIPSLYIPYITCSDPCGDGDIVGFVGFSPQYVKQGRSAIVSGTKVGKAHCREFCGSGGWEKKMERTIVRSRAAVAITGRGDCHVLCAPLTQRHNKDYRYLIFSGISMIL
jgi:hypothetical protein